MSNHEITVVDDLSGQICQARCTCKDKSALGSRGDIAEWIFKHRRQVETAKAALSRHTPTLRTTLAWFRSQQDDDHNSADDRAMWKQLADEIDHFVAVKTLAPQREQPPLW